MNKSTKRINNFIRNNKFGHLVKLFTKITWDDITALLSRKEVAPIIDLYLKVWLTIGGSISVSIVKGISFMIRHFIEISKTQGIKGLVLNLKVCYVITQQALGGHKVHDLALLGPRVSRTRKGLPRCIPVLWRRNLSNPFMVRLILSLFSLYRVLDFPGTLKLKSITDPFNGRSGAVEELEKYIPFFFHAMGFNTRLDKVRSRVLNRAKGWDYFNPIYTKSPTTDRGKGSFVQWSSHYISVSRSILSMRNDGYLYDNFKQIAAITAPSLRQYVVSLEPKISVWGAVSNNPLLVGFKTLWQGTVTKGDKTASKRVLKWALKRASGLKDWINVGSPNVADWRLVRRVFSSGNHTAYPLGRLSLKDEPAGKIRVFAMVDPITQWTLKPIHDIIFNLIKVLPMDGTFNQVRPLKFMVGSPSLWSLDLSSATDRLPLSLQVKIMDIILPGLGKVWGDFLVNRDYVLKEPGSPSVKLRYAVGQPMGAYSSWAMLAITHHFIVQVAAWKSGVTKTGTRFSGYALLGDDIVISNSRVAKAYLSIMTDIGVSCGLHKSLISKRGVALEFAKRFLYKGVDCSPISLREVISGLVSPSSLSAYAHKYSLSLTQAIKIAGFGYKVLGSLNKSWDKLSQRVRDISILYTLPSGFSSFISRSQFQRQLHLGPKEFLRFLSQEFLRLHKEIDSLISKAEALEDDYLQSSYEIGGPWWKLYHEFTFMHKDHYDRQIYRLELLLDGLRETRSEVSEILNRDIPVQSFEMDLMWSYFVRINKELSLISMTPFSFHNKVWGQDPRSVSLWRRWKAFLLSPLAR